MGICDDDRSQAPVPDDDGTSPEEEEEGTLDARGDEQQENNIWAQAEGYTPLSDMAPHTSMMVSTGYASDGESDNELGENNNSGVGDWRESGGAFFVDVTSGLVGNSGHESGTANKFDSEVARIPNETGNYDFESIADKALSLLEQEYERTIKGERQHRSWEESQKNAKVAVGDNQGTVIVSPGLEGRQREQSDLEIIAAAFEERKEAVLKHGFVAQWDHLVPQEATKLAGRDVDSKKEKNDVDTDAVRKVVEALSLKSDNPFQKKFKEWEQKYQPLPPTHSLIPLTPYKAFKRNTEKAREATASLSRSATLAEALCRLRQQDLLPLDVTTLIIDVVGVDHVECGSVERIQSTFRPIVRWIGIWKGCKFEHVHFRLVGRDLVGAIQDPVNLISPKASTFLQSAYATCHSGVYDAWLVEMKKDYCGDSPHIAIAYNSGIWGYNEWEPTIRYLSEQTDQPIPFVSTAYTLEECQEDHEVIEKAVRHNALSRILWEAQSNPFGSKMVRETKSRSNEYRENAAWQAWLLGGESA